MGRRNRIADASPLVQRAVLDMYADGQSLAKIQAGLQTSHGFQVSLKSIYNYLEKVKREGLRPDTSSFKTAEELLAEGGKVYNDIYDKYTKATSRQERMAYLQEMRNWWDRLSKVTGLMAPDGGTNVTIMNQVNQVSVVDQISGILCPACKVAVMNLEPPGDAPDPIPVPIAAPTNGDRGPPPTGAAA